MGRINVGRVVLGGIVAGIVADVLGYVVDGVLLASQWAEGMKALGRPDFTTNQLIGFNIIGLAAGIFTMLKTAKFTAMAGLRRISSMARRSLAPGRVGYDGWECHSPR